MPARGSGPAPMKGPSERPRRRRGSTARSRGRCATRRRLTWPAHGLVLPRAGTLRSDRLPGELDDSRPNRVAPNRNRRDHTLIADAATTTRIDSVVPSWLGSSSASSSSRPSGPSSGYCRQSATGYRVNCARPPAMPGWSWRSRACPRWTPAPRSESPRAGNRGMRRSIAWRIDSRCPVEYRMRRLGCCSGLAARTATSRAGPHCPRPANCPPCKQHIGGTSPPSSTVCRAVVRPWKPTRATSVGTAGSVWAATVRRPSWRVFEMVYKRSANCTGNLIETRRATARDRRVIHR